MLDVRYHVVMLGLMALVVVGCSHIGVWKPRTNPSSEAQLVIELPHGDVVYDVNMRRPELVYPFIQKVDEGYYDGMYVSWGIPGLLVQTGDPQWVRKATWSMGGQEFGRPAKQGELGMMRNADGSYGPYVNMMMQSVSMARGEVPDTLVLGWLVEGGDALAKVRKGDKIYRMYGRGFDASKEPKYVPFRQ